MPTADFEPYPDEIPKITRALERLQVEFEFTPMNESNKRIFEMSAHNEFGEAGFLVQIEWKEIYKNGLPTGIHLPHLEVTGRNKVEEEHDHDRHQWGVVKGLADGQPGYVRESGEKREDPLKKNIY